MAYAKMTTLEFRMSQIKTDGEMSPQIFAHICEVAKEWSIPPETMAWLGGKPYPTQGALYSMLKNKCEAEGLIVTSIKVKPLSRPEGQTLRAGSEAEISLFDQKGFNALMEKAKELPPVESIRELKGMFTHNYREEGWASPDTVRMRTMHNHDYIIHMAQTRGVDRCLRIIVRCPFTAASELPQGEPGFLKDIEAMMGAEPPISKPPGKEGAPALSKPGEERKVPDKPIKPISTEKPAEKVSKPGEADKSKEKAEEKDPKKAKLNEVQIDSALVRWKDYCNDRAPALSKKDVDEKRVKLLRALFQKERVGELVVGELEELFGLMDRGEIEVSATDEIKK